MSRIISSHRVRQNTKEKRTLKKHFLSDVFAFTLWIHWAISSAEAITGPFVGRMRFFKPYSDALNDCYHSVFLKTNAFQIFWKGRKKFWIEIILNAELQQIGIRDSHQEEDNQTFSPISSVSKFRSLQELSLICDWGVNILPPDQNGNQTRLLGKLCSIKAKKSDLEAQFRQRSNFWYIFDQFFSPKHIVFLRCMMRNFQAHQKLQENSLEGKGLSNCCFCPMHRKVWGKVQICPNHVLANLLGVANIWAFCCVPKLLAQPVHFW